MRTYIDAIKEVGVPGGWPWQDPTRLEQVGILLDVLGREKLLRLLAAPEGSCRVREVRRPGLKERLDALSYTIRLEALGYTIRVEDGCAEAQIEGRTVARACGESEAEALAYLAGELGVGK